MAPCACRWTRAVTVAALFLLSGATASVMALAWKVTMANRADVAEGCALAAQGPVSIAQPAPPKGRSRFALDVPGGLTHVPDELWAHAETIAGHGINIVLTETTLPNGWVDDLEKEIGPAAGIASNTPHRGVRIISLGASSIARAAGLQEGDVVDSVNGYALDSPDALPTAYASVREQRGAVIHIRRAERTIVLRLRIGD